MKYLHTGLLALLLMATTGVSADTTDLETIKRLAAEGKQDIALQRLDERIAANNDDVQARYLKGLLLMEQGDLWAARDVFTAISEQFPNLPEPYNNLAAIYAHQGDYDQARQALVSAVRSAPDYALVRSNLGDLYISLALDAYRKAVALDPRDQGSQAKMKLLELMVSPGS